MAVRLLSNNNNIAAVPNRLYSGEPLPEILLNGFFTINNQLVVTHWNKAAEKLLGISEKDILGKNLWEKCFGILPLKFYAACQKALLQNTPGHFEKYWGEMGNWSDVITYHCNDTLSVSFKSNKHVHPEHPDSPTKRLKIMTELYRFVTEITNDCLWEWNLQSGEIFWIDGGHKRVLGYNIQNSTIPLDFWESLIHPDDKERVLAGLNKTLTDGSSLWQDEYRYKKADGDYVHVHDRGHIVYEDGKASRIIGAIEDITDRVMLENTLAEERQTRQREITTAVLTGQEKERSEIGKELHDNLNQVLAVAKLYIQLAGSKAEKRDIYLDKSAGFVMNVIQEIRRIAKTLVIPGMHGISLAESIKSILVDLKEVDPIKIDFLEHGINEKDLNETLQLTIFRIVQEQLNNILKHSEAKKAIISLSRQGDCVVLVISDNGVGCDIVKEKQGVGIINIKSRAELYHGHVTIQSKPGEGYELKVTLPLKS